MAQYLGPLEIINVTDVSNDTSFSINQGNNIILYYKDNKLYNPFNYFLNNGDYIVYNKAQYKILFIFNNVINFAEHDFRQFITTFNNNTYYQFYYPYQPCTMENLIFDGTGKILNNNLANINYYFELKKKYFTPYIYETVYFYKQLDNFEYNYNLYNKSLYTRVLKLPKIQYYFENKTNNYIQGKLITISTKNYIQIEKNNLEGYDFFLNQPILINNIIKIIKSISYTVTHTTFVVTDNFLSDTLNLEGMDINNLKIYIGKKNIQNIYSNYLLDKVNYLKPKVNLGLYHYYHIIKENTNNEEINYKKSDILNKKLDYTNIDLYLKDYIHTLVFDDNVLLNTSYKYDISSFPIDDNSFNYLNYNNSYYILLEKTETNQYVSHLCQIKFQNKLKIFTPVENYKSTFYLNKIYPIKLNIDNTFEYLDLVIYKQTILNKKPANEIHIFKKFNISVNGIIESLSNGYFKVEVNIGDLSNYINNSDIYTNNKILCRIIQDETNSLYYLETSNYPGD
jgi:hypothetical protein